MDRHEACSNHLQVETMSRAALLEKLKEWPRQELERFACKLLLLNRPDFHGSLTFHVANGTPKKLVETVTKDI
jgi:hypothetical protein